MPQGDPGGNFAGTGGYTSGSTVAGNAGGYGNPSTSTGGVSNQGGNFPGMGSGTKGGGPGTGTGNKGTSKSKNAVGGTYQYNPKPKPKQTPTPASTKPYGTKYPGIGGTTGAGAESEYDDQDWTGWGSMGPKGPGSAMGLPSQDVGSTTRSWGTGSGGNWQNANTNGGFGGQLGNYPGSGNNTTQGGVQGPQYGGGSQYGGWADGGLIEEGDRGWVGERGREWAEGVPGGGVRITPMSRLPNRGQGDPRRMAGRIFAAGRPVRGMVPQRAGGV